MTVKPALVFVPGLLCDAELWHAQLAALEADFDCMVADITQDDSIAAMAKRVLEEAPARFSLIALSMGGYVAFEMWRQAPERIEKLVLLDTSAGPDDARQIEVRKAGIESLKLGKFMGVTNQLLPRLIHADHVHGPVGHAVKEMTLRVGGDAYLRQQTAILGRQDSLDTLGTITVPTLVGVGDSDRLTPVEKAEEIAAGIAGAKLHVFPHCGHLPPMECAGETSELLREFLKTNL